MINLRASQVFSEEVEISLQLAPNERIVFRCETSKRSRWGMWQKRSLMLTNMRVIYLNGRQFKNTIQLQKITALTKSLDDQLFLLHVEN